FTDFNAKLPLATRILLSFSDWIGNHQYVVYLVIAVPLLLIVLAIGTARGRELRDRVLLRTPILGDLIRHAILERFCRVLSAMVTAGVPMPEALAVSGEATGNVVFKEGLGRARAAVLR